MRHLILDMTAPLMSWGGPRIDGLGPTGRLPGLSALTGIIANALGLRNTEGERLNALQKSITFAAREDREGNMVYDYQTAEIGAKDKGWMRTGVAERAGGAASYDSPKIMKRYFLEDQHVVVAVSVNGGPFSIEEVGAAIRSPARPIFFGRKPFLPTRPIFAGLVEADDVLAALRSVPCRGDGNGHEMLAVWPEDIGGGHLKQIRDVKDWAIGTHVGVRNIREGSLTATMAA